MSKLVDLQPYTATLVVGALGALTVTWLIGQVVTSRGVKRPPGPPGLPLLGNLLNFPKVKGWLVFARWAEEYGNIIGLEIPVLNTSIVVLNSEEDVKALFVARSPGYSSRVLTPMMKLGGWDHSTATLPLGDEFRTQRRLSSKLLGPQAMKRLAPVIDELVQVSLAGMKQPDGSSIQQHLRLLSARVIMGLAYGYDVTGLDDRFVRLANTALHNFFKAAEPDWVVNVVPFIQHLPSWLPGMGFLRKAVEFKYSNDQSHTVPYEWAKQQMEAGTAKPSFTNDILSDPENKYSDQIILNVLGDMFTAGSDTLVGICAMTVLALALFPDIQKRAQAEIDAVTGRERPLQLADRAALPYVEAIMQEVFRWHPVSNTGLPHVALADDEYRGNRIKEGTLLFANIWAILHNPDKYPEPFKFLPERYLNVNPPNDAPGMKVNENPRHIAFGFGPRICLGRNLADIIIWTFTVNLIAGSDISNAVYTTGVPVTPENIDFMDGPVSCVMPFNCDVEPRSTCVATVIGVKSHTV